jgi:hypothetical protein
MGYLENTIKYLYTLGTERHLCFLRTLTCERSNVVFKSSFFSLISNQSLSLHLNIVIQLPNNSKSVDMLKYKFHFKHLESRPELHGAIFIQDSVYVGFIVPPTDLILTSSYARRTYVCSNGFKCLWLNLLKSQLSSG